MKVVSIRMKEDEYELYRKLARMESKDLSSFVRSRLREAVRQNMKEANLLDRLLKLIEELPERLQLQLRTVSSSGSGEEFSQVARLLVYLIKLFELQCEYTIVLEAKRKEFQARKEELKKSLGVEV